MSFTTIQNTTSWQSLTIAREIRVAYNKRRTACGLSTYADPTNAVKVKDFVYAIQTGIEEMMTKFGDPTVTDFSGLTSLPANFASVAAGMTYAGLTATGYWRRIPMDSHAPVYSIYDNYPTSYSSGWSYGKLQSGDQAGPWLFCDLEKVLKALTRIYGFSSDAGTGYTAQVTHSNGTDGVGKAWTFPDDPVTGNVNTTAVTADPTSLESAIEVYKVNNTWAPDINSAGANFNLANFRLFCGHHVAGTSRTCTFITLPTGTDSLSALTGITALGVTAVKSLSLADQAYVNSWWPKTPAQVGTLAWQTILDQIPDGDVAFDTTVSKSMSLDWLGVAVATTYTFVDGATS